jgi:predicted nicotinamide N-methyase
MGRRLPLVEMTVSVGGRDWGLTLVRDQDALVDQVQSEEDLANFPYGLMLWPSALGLAEALATDEAAKSAVAGRRVLELGCGVGLAGLAARALGGAESVTQTDYQPDALALAAHNARANEVVGVTVRPGDWRVFPDLGRFDLVIGSDVLYERSLHSTLADLLPRLIAPGGAVLLSDPLRPQALEWLERQEKAGRWRVEIASGRRVAFEDEDKEIALFWLRPR